MTMKSYVGTKLINARPMNRADYNQLRGWTVPGDEDPADEGYLVEYTDGGKANVEGFKGYISWSPKAVFELAYRALPNVDASGLQPHQQRVVIEKAELDLKIEKLYGFIESCAFQEVIDDLERERLLRQYDCMMGYSSVLRRRIAAF